MFRMRRRDPLLIHDPDHDRAKREALAEAEFDALLDRLWGPESPWPKPSLTRAEGEPEPPFKSTWRERLHGSPDTLEPDIL